MVAGFLVVLACVLCGDGTIIDSLSLWSFSLFPLCADVKRRKPRTQMPRCRLSGLSFTSTKHGFQVFPLGAAQLTNFSISAESSASSLPVAPRVSAPTPTQFADCHRPSATDHPNEAVRALASKTPLTHRMHRAELKLFGYVFAASLFATSY